MPFLTVATSIYIPTSNAKEFWVLLILAKTYFLVFSNLSSIFCIVVILMCVKWYLTLVLICISLMIRGVKHIFMCLSTICISPFNKCLFKTFAHFEIRLVAFVMLSCRSPSYILDINPYQIYDLQIFSPILWVAFSLCW